MTVSSDSNAPAHPLNKLGPMFVAQLKGMFLAALLTVVVARILAHVSDLFTATQLTSAGLALTLPIGALVGRLASDPSGDRVARLLAAAFVPTMACALPVWRLLDREDAASLFGLACLMWLPSALAALALERWTRPRTDPQIPRCVVYKPLL